MFKLRTVQAAKSLTRRVLNRIEPHGLIILYHRITHLEADPHCLAVTPAHFAEHLDVLSRVADPMSLEDLKRHLMRGRIPRRSVAITFDDGYADNLVEAEPILARKRIPATFFVATQAVGSNVEFYWDEVERVLFGTTELPEAFETQIDGRYLHWNLRSSESSIIPAAQRWNVLNAENPTPRHRMFRELCSILKRLAVAEREVLIDRLLAWSGATKYGRRTHRSMTWDEVRQLENSPVATIGAHTHTHPMLSALSPARQLKDIEMGLEELRTHLSKTPWAFAYPYGAKEDYNAQTVAVAEQCGFGCACSNYGGKVRSNSSAFELPREMIFDWDGDEFARRLPWR